MSCIVGWLMHTACMVAEIILRWVLQGSRVLASSSPSAPRGRAGGGPLPSLSATVVWVGGAHNARPPPPRPPVVTPPMCMDRGCGAGGGGVQGRITPNPPAPDGLRTGDGQSGPPSGPEGHVVSSRGPGQSPAPPVRVRRWGTVHLLVLPVLLVTAAAGGRAAGRPPCSGGPAGHSRCADAVRCGGRPGPWTVTPPAPGAGGGAQALASGRAF